MAKGSVVKNGYEALALEVVRQAVDDYRMALQFKTGKGISAKCTENTIKECEEFFRSDMMDMYAPGINGEAIIKTMRQRFSSAIPSYYEDNK